ncbi:MAG: hypothetical protein QY328_17325 [Anaerolineales bacterium]|nr:MAG: hypothetical protein QY328_17325 [Anaerolineales bacterium]
MAPRELLSQTQAWLEEKLSKLRTTAIESHLHTTDLVSAEYKPENGYLGTRGLPRTVIQAMAQSVKSQFKITTIDITTVSGFRTLPGANRRLVRPNDGLSNNDLSLVQLGLEMTKLGASVVILSNDQDLIDFTSWIKTQASLRTNGQDPRLLEIETGLGYLELIHRSCLIPSDQMNQMINFVIKNTFSRMQQLPDGTQLNHQKAMKIIQQATQVNSLFGKAVEIKAQNRSAVP